MVICIAVYRPIHTIIIFSPMLRRTCTCIVQELEIDVHSSIFGIIYIKQGLTIIL